MSEYEAERGEGEREGVCERETIVCYCSAKESGEEKEGEVKTPRP